MARANGIVYSTETVPTVCARDACRKPFREDEQGRHAYRAHEHGPLYCSQECAAIDTEERIDRFVAASREVH